MKGIIFDMDGTMVDNMMIHHRAWQKQLASLGLEMSLEEVQEKIHGVNHEILERLFGDRFTPAERLQIANAKEAAYREIFLPELQLIDGLAGYGIILKVFFTQIMLKKESPILRFSN